MKKPTLSKLIVALGMAALLLTGFGTAATAKTTAGVKNAKGSAAKVTILVNCSNAAKWNAQNGNKISAMIVPKNGVVLAKKTVALKAGDTAYSLLIRAGMQYKLYVTHLGSNYIDSIHGLKQFACGSASGWMYSVNGKYPGTACNSYKLKKGDRLEWRYTVTSGDLKKG